MLYNGHLIIADTFLKNQPNHDQTLIEKPLYSEHFYSRYLLLADTSFERRVNILAKVYFLIADTIWLIGKKENMHVFIRHISLL